jgi:hypothetical protein
VLIYSVSVGLYVSALSGIIAVSLNSGRATLIQLGLMIAAWLRIRIARLEDWKVIGKLDFEEVPEPAVMRLCIERD